MNNMCQDCDNALEKYMKNTKPMDRVFAKKLSVISKEYTMSCEPLAKELHKILEKCEKGKTWIGRIC